MTGARSFALFFALFPTALGTCAIAWNDVGLTGVWLPEAGDDSLRRRVMRRCADAAETAPTGRLATVVEQITRLLAGEHVDLRGVALDSSGIDPFDRRVYDVTREIGAGRVLTYGEVAARVGAGATAREVGQSLGRNSMPIVVPCHRVVATGGLGGFSAPGGTSTKRRLLAIEDAQPAGPPGLFDAPDSETGSEAGDAGDDRAASGREARTER
ncbi:MAG TPA: methylated-DNA--[protein]-cysteine S-methyltransferase [Caldimonas sp.]|jgi:methylated-DNA-[protein]-cysteine S-methyltransferase|nr:methylated-DNA--[protein]-cysteine S-methyltransferase [Caldimonas sp.]